MAYRSKNYKRRRGRKVYKAAKKSLGKPMAKAVKAIVKSQMNQVIETKHADYYFEPIPLNALYHNTWYNFESDPFTLNQGVQDSEALNPLNRIGDSIFVKGILFKILLTNFSSSPNNIFRVVIIKCKAGSAGITNPTLHPQLGNNLLAPVEKEDSRVRSVVYDRTFSTMSSKDSGDLTHGIDKTMLWTHFVPVNKKIKYDDGQAASGNDVYRPYVLMYQTQACLTTTNIGRFTYFRRTYFQDA